MLARASTKTFISRVRKTAKEIFVSRKIRYQGHSLAEVSLYCKIFKYVSYEVNIENKLEAERIYAVLKMIVKELSGFYVTRNSS